MKHTPLFRLWAMMTILFYSAAFAQAGQIITQDDRFWVQEAMKQEAGLGAISTPNSIAVLYFNNKSGEDKLNLLQKGLAVMLITDLSKIEQFQVVERVRMQALLDEMDLGASGLMDAENTPTVGKLLGAYYVVSGDILKGKKQEIAINSSILDTPFETITMQPTVTGALDELFKLEKEVLFNIVEQLKIPISPDKKEELQKPLSMSTAALLALFLGIENSDKGLYAEAANMYKQALVEDPNLKMAKNALQELKAMELTAVNEPLVTPPAEAGGSSVGTVLGIGLAIAAIGGAAAFALSGSSDDDNNGDGTLPPDNITPGDTTAPTATPNPPANSDVSCESGTVIVTFSESMDESVGQANIFPKGFAGGSWSGGQYNVSWEQTSDYCSKYRSGSSYPESLVIGLVGFRDSAQNPMSVTQFSYTIQ